MVIIMMPILRCIFSALIALYAASVSDAFVALQFKTAPAGDCRSAFGLRATPADAISRLEASQASTVQNLVAAIPDLAVKADFSWEPGSGVAIAGFPASLDARDAPGPANIAWLSSLNVASKLSSLTIFNGPLTSVPHLLSRCAVVNENSLLFTLDFRPRAYGAYEMVRPDGTYPDPDELGRKSFEYSGARTEYESKFGNDQVKAFLSSTMASFEDASVVPGPTSEFDGLTRGPLILSVTMPLTDGNVAAVESARLQAANIWLSWAQSGEHDHRPGAPVNTQYVYDSKYKQNAYSALLPVYIEMFGSDEGARLAAADSGPLDEGYVGGGS